MKNLHIGLVFTLGLFGFSLANTIKITNDIENAEGNLISIEMDKTKIECTIATHIVVYDSCGNYLWTFKDSYWHPSSDCEGLIINRREEEISGCIN